MFRRAVVLCLLLLAGGMGRAEEATSEDAPRLYPFGAERAFPSDADKDVDEAIDGALAWLAAHQNPIGRWDTWDHDLWCNGAKKALPVNRTPKFPHDVGVTGLSICVFLGAGHTDRDGGTYAETVRRGLAWLASRQDEEGCFGSRNHQRFVYEHAWATLAMVEAFGMTGDARWRASAQRGLTFTCQARNPYFAWRYGVKTGENDTSVTTDLVQALFAARRINDAAREANLPAPLTFDEEAFDGTRAWLRKMTDADYGRIGYRQRGGPVARYQDQDDAFERDYSEAITAAGLWLLTELRDSEEGDERDLTEKMAELLLNRPARWFPGGVDLYYWYYARLGLHGADRGARTVVRADREWRRATTEVLCATQDLRGGVCGHRGSWPPEGAWGVNGGRVYSTALSSLILLTERRFAKREDLSKALVRVARANSEAEPLRMRALDDLARLDPEAFRAASGGLAKEPLAAVRSRVVEHLLGQGDPDRKAVALFGRLAKDRDPGVRARALRALGEAGSQAERHLEKIVEALDEEELEIRRAAVEALGALGELAGTAVPRLDRFLADPADPMHVPAALAILAITGDRERVQPALVAALESEDPNTRRDAGRALGTSVPAWFEPTAEQIRHGVEARVPVAFENELGMRFVLVLPGTFLMGSPEEETERLSEETLHEVTLTKPFYVQVTEVTNAQYRACHPGHSSGSFGEDDVEFNADDQPVTFVGHVEAKFYADWLSVRDGFTYRLPTEAEWEYVARAGTTERYWWGDDEAEAGTHENVADMTLRDRYPGGVGNLVEVTPQWRWFDTRDGHIVTAPVASYDPNPWGLYDVLGNVSEWTLDWRDEYPSEPVTDPKGPRGGRSRVPRGGSWASSPQQARSAMRAILPTPLQPGEPNRGTGFRLVAEPDAE